MTYKESIIQMIACNVCLQTQCTELAEFTSDLDKEHYHVMRCNGCGLLFLHPLPVLTAQRLEEIYNEDYAESVYPAGYSKLIENALNRQMEIVEKYIKPGKALNVGAMGEEVKVIKQRGWKLSLLDASKYAVERARLRGEVDEIILSTIEDFSCPPENYDFIKFGHIIEHLNNPANVLQKLWYMLRPGGVILIDTDNAEGLETRLEESLMNLMRNKFVKKVAEKLTGKKYNLRYGRLTPPVHLYTFTLKSLTSLVRTRKFRVLDSFNSSWGDPTWFPVYNKSLLEKIFISIDRFGSLFGHGNVIAVLAQKSKPAINNI